MNLSPCRVVGQTLEVLPGRFSWASVQSVTPACHREEPHQRACRKTSGSRLKSMAESGGVPETPAANERRLAEGAKVQAYQNLD